MVIPIATIAPRVRNDGITVIFFFHCHTATHRNRLLSLARKSLRRNLFFMLPANQRLFEKPGDKHAAIETAFDAVLTIYPRCRLDRVHRGPLRLVLASSAATKDLCDLCIARFKVFSAAHGYANERKTFSPRRLRRTRRSEKASNLKEIFSSFVLFECSFENTGRRGLGHFKQNPSICHSSMECWNPD